MIKHTLKFYGVLHKFFKVCLTILQIYEIKGFRDIEIFELNELFVMNRLRS